jgi:hypothetical protein
LQNSSSSPYDQHRPPFLPATPPKPSYRPHHHGHDPHARWLSPFFPFILLPRLQRGCYMRNDNLLCMQQK